MATKLPGRAFGHDHVDTQESCKQLTHTLPRVRSGRFKLLGLIKHHAYLRLLKNRSTLVGKAVALSRCASVNRTRRPTSPAHRSRVSPATQPHRQRAPVVGAATHSASAQLTSAWLAAGWGVLPVSHGQVACCRWLPGLPFEVRRAWSIVAVISPPAAPSRCRAEAVPRSSTSPPPLAQPEPEHSVGSNGSLVSGRPRSFPCSLSSGYPWQRGQDAQCLWSARHADNGCRAAVREARPTISR